MKFIDTLVKEKSKIDKTLLISTIIKYGLSVFWTILAIQTVHTIKYAVYGLCELLIIAVVTNLIVADRPIPAYVFNVICCFFFNVQMAVLFFGSSYVSAIMLSNMDSLEDLSGKAVAYIGAVVVVIITAILPIRAIGRKLVFQYFKRFVSVLILVIMGEAMLLIIEGGASYSPIVSCFTLLRDEYQIHQMRFIVNNNMNSANEVNSVFYSEEIGNFRKKEESFTDSPNLILIFTEGLSQNIVDDERGIMQNVAALQEKSLTFTNYYNHTAATYRGLIGQLYSGYQLENLDENGLISIQSILKENGYHTAFINTEPYNENFTEYLDTFDFDEVIGETENIRASGETNSLTDKEAYQVLWDTAESFSKSEEPFFIGIYTFGTHATFGSPDEVFEDGSDDELNKFYNADIQFGEFLEKFENSNLAEDTLLVFTTDHATYLDNAFSNAFSDYTREVWFLDTIPLSIYYVGMTPELIDAQGRNSLDLVPTILDYLDISAPNYFLGTSLFSDTTKWTSYENIWYCEADYRITNVDGISELTKAEKDYFNKMVQQYFEISRN